MQIMQRLSIKGLMLFVGALAICGSSFAQQKGKAKSTPKKASTGAASPFGNAPATTPTPKSTSPFGGGASSTPSSTPASGGGNPFSSSNAQPASSSNPFASGSAQQPPQGGAKSSGSVGGNVPIKVVKPTTSNDPLNDSNRPSMRNESAIISNIKDRNPLAYDDIREDDAIYRQRIWKVIDAREKINAPFAYSAVEDNGSQLFFSILFRAITEDSVVAFDDERFTVPYKDIQKFREKFSGGVDTSDVQDLEGNVIGKEVRMREFPVDSVYRFMIKEEVIFDKEAAKLVHRIVGIAPMGPAIIKGKVYPGPAYPYFWVYYPDIRKTLAKKQVYNAKNLGARMTWEDYLENHMFSYYIVKSSMDNVRNLKLDDYITNPMFKLFEGEKIKEKMFNYEQGLWSY